MDFAVALGLLLAITLLASAAASAAAAFLLLHYCLCARRSAAAPDAESPPPPPPMEAKNVQAEAAAPKHGTTVQETAVGGGGGVRRCTWAEVEALTGGFAEAAVVGRGGFSTVYLARLGSGDGMVAAAVKVCRCGGGERRLRAFRQELELLRRFRHPHIVRLLAYSDDHEEEGALILEYHPGGTLAGGLHDSGGSRPPLSWAHRMRVLHDLAGALEHLHAAGVVHGDVTAANVLLGSGGGGAGGGARLCDFGSARAGFSAAVAAAAVGSPGYADPFFLRTGIVSKKSDVYSFGVVALEAVTGLPAVGLDGGRNLTAEILPRVRAEGVAGLVDPALGEEYDVAEADDVARIAIECVGMQPALRPAMARVRAAIEEKAARSIAAADRRSDGLDFSSKQ